MLLDFTYEFNDPQFTDGEVVEFVIEEVSPTTQGFYLKTEIKSGDHATQGYGISFPYRIRNGQESFSTKNFLKIFYSKRELETGMDINKLIKQRFSATAVINKREEEIFTNWKNFKKIGIDDNCF